MSFDQIKSEIFYFLSSDEPQVICIRGKWGVGKTYGWKQILLEFNKANPKKATQYSYVSLFGLNSLEDLRYAIFESTVSGNDIDTGPSISSLKDMVKKLNHSRKLRPIFDMLSSFFNQGRLVDVFLKSAFLMVRNQLICLDDLERAGANLGARDVLGLASQLKEDRRCKVVLLLNDQEHDDKEEFSRQLEKVADSTLLFDLTSEEASSIAISATSPAIISVKPLIVKLGITNIRVIKRIERLAGRLIELLADCEGVVVSQAVATLVLASWSVQQPSFAPPLEFIRRYNRIHFEILRGRKEMDPDDVKHWQLLEGYPYDGPTELDLAIIESVAAGYFNSKEIVEFALSTQEKYRNTMRDKEYSRVWKELYHGSLATEDNEFFEALYNSAIDEAKFISPSNINSAILLLRENGRNEKANKLVEKYVVAHDAEGYEFFDINEHHFSSSLAVDDGLRTAFAQRLRTHTDNRDPLEVLRSIGRRRGADAVDIVLMARQSAEDFERMFEALQGDDVRNAVETILEIGRRSQQGCDAVRESSNAALRRIAGKSNLRAQKIRALGVELEPREEDNNGAATAVNE